MKQWFLAAASLATLPAFADVERYVVDPRHTIARAIDQVDAILAAIGFTQPMRKGEFDVIAGFGKCFHRPRAIRGADK